MDELVIISGKGGTGKTSLTAAFAVLAAPVVVADCDVDAADLALLLEPSNQVAEPFRGGVLPLLDSQRCTACGACLDACRFGAVTVVRNDGDTPHYGFDAIACEGCGVCAAVCPADAITLHEHTSGELFTATARVGPMVHARLGIAEEHSGKLAAMVRSRAKERAAATGLDLVIVDGPPGAGCPVISSITGARAVCIVTEPTVSGAHDLERVAELARHCRVPATVLVNKFDLNPAVTEQIESFCRDSGISYAGRVPYSPQVTRAMLAHRTLADEPRPDVFPYVAAAWQHVHDFIRTHKNTP